ncbi:MAG: uracil-DNA glycosylase [Candidatus Omnitrophica bacterium]|nr:uracil-DNA glycosylase [Candidatus Omnitrophota bacterium]
MVQFDLFEGSVNQILTASTYLKFKKLLSGSDCERCTLSHARTNIVVDRGNSKSEIIFIGEAPGEKEDKQGKAFVGRAGKLLDEFLLEIGIQSDRDILILNVVKCRPPENRAPLAEEASACSPFLARQLVLVQPKVIVLLGATALKYLAKDKKEFEMHKEVGKFFMLPEYPGIQFFVIYHPAYLLYDPRKKEVFRNHLARFKQYLTDRRLL